MQNINFLNMKTIGIVLIGILTVVLMSMQFKSSGKSTVKTENQGILFKENASWSMLLETAKKENKILFIDVYASWCGPCKLLKKNTFSDEKTGDFFNKTFINAAFDAEQGEGVEIARKFNVQAFPTLIFVSPAGTVVKKAVGYHTPEELVKLGKEVIK